jgi:hypothetical protein
MNKEEFERLKAEEKAHLQKLRDLKRQHRDVQRKASSVNALRNMRNEELESETDRLTEDLMRGAALNEARLDLALEGQAPQTGNVDDVDREALAKAEAEALVKQMKAAMGGGLGGPTPNEAIDPVQNPGGPVSSDPLESHGQRPADPSGDVPALGGKTIGRTPPPEEPPPAGQDGKTIGRRRDA